jgi:hypothetical protein
MAGCEEWEVDDEDDDEEDFVPDADDEDDEDFRDEHEEDGGYASFPTFLEGDLFMDKLKGLSYERAGSFSLKCQQSVPVCFSIESPVLNTILKFGGWIQDPNDWMEFDTVFCKQALSSDPFELRILQAQEERMSLVGSGRVSSFNRESPMKHASAKANLKSPPSYSLNDSTNDDEESDQDKKSPAKAKLKEKPSLLQKAEFLSPFDKKSATEKDEFVFVMTGLQTGGDSDRRISFRGAYCKPPGPSKTLYLICSIGLNGDNSAVVNASSNVAPSEAASARKRTRSDREDDDSVEGKSGVEYQELIDLHDDAGLSTEALRQRYYGGGSGNVSRAASSAAKTKPDDSGSSTGNRNDDDDDDAYGF